MTNLYLGSQYNYIVFVGILKKRRVTVSVGTYCLERTFLALDQKEGLYRIAPLSILMV